MRFTLIKIEKGKVEIQCDICGEHSENGFKLTGHTGLDNAIAVHELDPIRLHVKHLEEKHERELKK